jgi:hypothetical protein
LTNPNGDNQLFQAGTNGMAAWANAFNAAMLADAYRIVGTSEAMTHMEHYRDEAIAAYNFASTLPVAEQLLDRTQDIGYTELRGRDFKMSAAAYLYNITGDTAYEDVVNNESLCISSTSSFVYLDAGNSYDQTWAVAGYLMTPQIVNYQTLYENMKASVIDQAKLIEADMIEVRASRRATWESDATWFHTSQNVQRTIIAHAVADDQADKDHFLKALTLEADWGLGRNPLNMIHMGTAQTTLSSKRNVELMYTTGWDDGVDGMHPGHTPYLNLGNWGGSMVGNNPTMLCGDPTYPSDIFSWPRGEIYFPTPWVWAHSEQTPQQSMRGKAALYGYLLAVGDNTIPRITVTKTGMGSGTVTSAPPGLDCGATCTATFTKGDSITLTAVPDSDSIFVGWGGACSGTDPCIMTITAAMTVIATFGGGHCTTAIQCDDNDPCTTDGCSEGRCIYSSVPNCGGEDGSPLLSQALVGGCSCTSSAALSGMSVLFGVLLLRRLRRR